VTEPQAFSPPVVDGVDVDVVHDIVRRCDGVAALGSGLLGAAATYLPGRQVPGVRVNPGLLEIEVRAKWGARVDEIVDCIRSSLAYVAPGRRIDITIADIVLPGEQQEASAAELDPPPPRPELPPAAADRATTSAPESENR
jgi:hypothetical protein